jgi:hypothetical protein
MLQITKRVCVCATLLLYCGNEVLLESKLQVATHISAEFTFEVSKTELTSSQIVVTNSRASFVRDRTAQLKGSVRTDQPGRFHDLNWTCDNGGSWVQAKR